MTAVEQTCQDSELDILFPTPCLSQTVICPQRYPGTSPVAGLRHILKDNHTKHHIFFDVQQQFHNHITYHALALYATGQHPVVGPPDVITEENLIKHLSDDKRVSTANHSIRAPDYLLVNVAFFIKSIDKKGVKGRDTSTQPVMLIRVPVGYGTEFGIISMIAEGFKGLSMEDTHSLSPEPDQPKRKHEFSILTEIMQDLQFAPEERMKYMNGFNRLMTTHGADIWRHAEQWTTDLTQPGEIKRKMEQRKGLQLQTSCSARFSSLYGARPKGYFKGTELEGAEALFPSGLRD
ncbi:hypothetical protein M405DRAFT_881330 [Rhizopogon salebrosus TDB-379]|nr:hypothetical protein M405DRAFT_881330 [Rhizopogon salebrosus TDB-379]